MNYSVVIVLNKPRPEVFKTVRHLSEFLTAYGRDHEFVLVACALDTRHLEKLPFNELGEIEVKIVHFTRHVTTGTALSAALAHCDKKAIITSDWYLQFPDEEIHSLLDVFEQGADLVIPWRQNRVDPKINQLQSRFFNSLVQLTTKPKFNDLSCPVRVFRKEMLDSFHLYGDLYRFLPIVANERGYKVTEICCQHLHEEGETGIYSLREYVGRIIDYLTFHFDIFSSRKPLRYFGKRALYFLVPGTLLILFLLAGASLGFFPVGNSPWLIVSLLLLLLGSITWSVGLLGELIAFAMGRSKKEYLVEKVVGE